MPILPIRNLGQIGVVSDLNSYDLPLNGISRANNVRFDDGKIKRANVFRSVLATTSATPVFSFTYFVAGGASRLSGKRASVSRREPGGAHGQDC